MAVETTKISALVPTAHIEVVEGEMDRVGLKLSDGIRLAIREYVERHEADEAKAA